MHTLRNVTVSFNLAVRIFWWK